MSTPPNPPPWNEDFDVEPGVLTWLQAWYGSQCNGDWEHGYGVEIGTLDNPGWRVSINVSGTALEGKPRKRVKVDRGEHDWCHTWVEEGAFQAACGPLNLGEALHAFRVWAQPLDDEV